MTTVSLQYTDENGDNFKQDFNVMLMKGFTGPDEVQFVAVQHKLLNGGVSEQIRGFRRAVTFDFGVVEEQSDRLFIWEFLRHPRRRVVYGNDVIYAALGAG